MGLRIGKGKEGGGVRKPTSNLNVSELSKRILEKVDAGNTSCDPHGNVHAFSRLKSGRYTASDLVVPASHQEQSFETEQFNENASHSISPEQENFYSDQGCLPQAQFQIGLGADDPDPPVEAGAGAEPGFAEEPSVSQVNPAVEETAPKRKTREQKKSAMFSSPNFGAMKSKRGTIEVVFREGGRTLIPQYNVARVLQSVTSSDGRVFKRNADGITWSIFDAYGKEIPSPVIKLAAFDSDGNFFFVTANGIKTILKVDGSEVSEPAT